MVMTKLWGPVFHGADKAKYWTYPQKPMLTVDSWLWFSSRGERGDGRGGCCQNRQHRGYHAAQGGSRCHSTHGCLDTSRELGTGALEKKSRDTRQSLRLPPANIEPHPLGRPVRGKSCSSMVLAQTSLICWNPTAVSVFRWCGRGRLRTVVPIRISLKIWNCTALAVCLLYLVFIAVQGNFSTAGPERKL